MHKLVYSNPALIHVIFQKKCWCFSIFLLKTAINTSHIFWKIPKFFSCWKIAYVIMFRINSEKSELCIARKSPMDFFRWVIRCSKLIFFHSIPGLIATIACYSYSTWSISMKHKHAYKKTLPINMHCLLWHWSKTMHTHISHVFAFIASLLVTWQTENETNKIPNY